MVTPELNYSLAKLREQLITVNEVLKNQHEEISKLPKEERKPYWDDYFALKDYISESAQLINKFTIELEKRATTQQYNQVKQQLTAAREYIKVLGGEPSHLTYT